MITFIVDNGLYYDAHGILFLDVPRGWSRDLYNIEAAINIAVSPNGFVIGRASVKWVEPPNPETRGTAPIAPPFWEFVTPASLVPHPDATNYANLYAPRVEQTKKLPRDFLRRLLGVWPKDAPCRDLVRELVR